MSSQWETTSHCNIVSHWLGACTQNDPWSMPHFSVWVNNPHGFTKNHATNKTNQNTTKLYAYFMTYTTHRHMENMCINNIPMCIHKNWLDSQIPERTCSISHNAPFRTEMCTFLCSEWSIVGYGTGAFWDLWNSSTGHIFTTTKLTTKPCAYFMGYTASTTWFHIRVSCNAEIYLSQLINPHMYYQTWR